MEYWAVIVDISDYQLKILDMDANFSGAEEAFNLFGPIWGKDHIKVLINGEATKKNIEDAFCCWLNKSVDADDVILFYFMGHGGKEDLYPYDADYWANSISTEELSRWIGELKSNNINVVLDSCYSGSFIPALSKDGRVILTSSEAGQLSYSSYALNKGVFTDYFLAAFSDIKNTDKDRDFDISIEEAFGYAQSHVVNYWGSDHKDWSQNPQIDDQSDGDISLFYWADFDLAPHESSLSMIIDGKTYSSDELPVSFKWMIGTEHSYSINSTNPAWISLPAKNISQGESDHLVYLNLESEYGDPQGEGWYREGTNVSISVKSPSGAIIKDVFAGWSGDPTITSQSNTTVLMDRTKTVVAKWHKDYTYLYVLVAGLLGLLAMVVIVFMKRKHKPQAPTF